MAKPPPPPPMSSQSNNIDNHVPTTPETATTPRKIPDALKVLLLEKAKRYQQHSQHSQQQHRRETSVGGEDCSTAVQRCMDEFFVEQAICMAWFC